MFKAIGRYWRCSQTAKVSTVKKLVLTFPNQLWQKTDSNTNWNLNPATLCQLAVMMKGEVHITILDAQFHTLSESAFSERIREINPDYVGISVLTSEYGETLDITARLVKEVDPNIVVIGGGIHVTTEFATLARNPDIDYLVRGEGEYVLRDLLRHLSGKGDLPGEGLVYRDGNDETVVQPQAFVPDLAALPWPDFSFVDLAPYTNTGPRLNPGRPPAYPYMRISVTRGCPFGCSFCQVETINGHKIRTRAPADIVDQLIEYRDRHGIRSFLFEDDNIIGKRKFFAEMLREMIRKELNVPFIIGAFAIFLLNDEILDLMVRAGCKSVNVAIETGSDRVMKEIVGKPMDLSIVPDKIRQIQDKGLSCLANFIIGFPGESWAEIRETISYAETCGADYVKFFAAVPLKNTRMWDMALEQNAFSGDPTGVKVEWRYSQIKSKEWTSRDITILRAYEWDRINFSTLEKRKRQAELWGLSIEELDAIRKETRDALHAS